MHLFQLVQDVGAVALNRLALVEVPAGHRADKYLLSTIRMTFGGQFERRKPELRRRSLADQVVTYSLREVERKPRLHSGVQFSQVL